MKNNKRGHCFEAEDASPGAATDAKTAIDLIVEMVQTRYVTDPTQQVPMVFAFREGNVATIIQLDFDNDDAKNSSIRTAEKLLRESGCDASVFVSEGWMVNQPSAIEVRPSLNPRRIEVLLVEASSPGHHVVAMYEMVRNLDSRFITFKQLNYVDDMVDQGATLKTKFDFFN